jgi:hypothetical protein
VIAQSLDSSNVDVAIYRDTTVWFDGCAVLEITSQGAYEVPPSQLARLISDMVRAYGLHPGSGFALINTNPSLPAMPDAIAKGARDALASLGYTELRERTVRLPDPITHNESDGILLQGIVPPGLEAVNATPEPPNVLHCGRLLVPRQPDILFAASGALAAGQAAQAFHIPRNAYLARGAIRPDGHIMTAHEIVYRIVSSGGYTQGQPLGFYAEAKGLLTQEHIDRLAEQIADIAQVPVTHICNPQATRSPGPLGSALEVIEDQYARSIEPEPDLRHSSPTGLGVLQGFGKEKVAFKSTAADPVWGGPVTVTIQRTPNGSSFIRPPDQIGNATRGIQALGYPTERIRRTSDIFGRPAWVGEEHAVIFDSKSNHRPGSKLSPCLNETTLAHLHYMRELAAKTGNELVDAQIGIRPDGIPVLRDTGLVGLTGVHGSGRGLNELLDIVEAETRLNIAQRDGSVASD